MIGNDERAIQIHQCQQIMSIRITVFCQFTHQGKSGQTVARLMRGKRLLPQRIFFRLQCGEDCRDARQHLRRNAEITRRTARQTQTVGKNGATVFIKTGEAPRRFSISLHRRFFQPLPRPAFICCDAQTRFIKNTEFQLRPSIVLQCCFFIPCKCRGIILGDTIAVFIQVGEIDLSPNATMPCGSFVPGKGFIKILRNTIAIFV